MKKDRMKFRARITFTRYPVQYFFVITLMLASTCMITWWYYLKWFTEDYDKYDSETESYEARVDEWKDSIVTAKFVLVGKIPEKTFVMRRITSPNVGLMYVYGNVKASKYVSREIGDTCELTGTEKGISYYIEDKKENNPGKPTRKTERPHSTFEIVTVIFSLVTFLIVGFVGFDDIPSEIQTDKEFKYWWRYLIMYLAYIILSFFYAVI